MKYSLEIKEALEENVVPASILGFEPSLID